MTGEQQQEPRDGSTNSALSDLKELLHAMHGYRHALVLSDLPDDVRSAVEARGEMRAIRTVLSIIERHEAHGEIPEYGDHADAYASLSRAVIDTERSPDEETTDTDERHGFQ